MELKRFNEILQTHKECSDFHGEPCVKYQFNSAFKSALRFKKIYSIYFFFILFKKLPKFKK